MTLQVAFLSGIYSLYYGACISAIPCSAVSARGPPFPASARRALSSAISRSRSASAAPYASASCACRTSCSESSSTLAPARSCSAAWTALQVNASTPQRKPLGSYVADTPKGLEITTTSPTPPPSAAAHVTVGGDWQGIFGVIWPVHRCRCLKSCAPMTEVGCTGHQPRLAGTPGWRVSAASDPV